MRKFNNFNELALYIINKMAEIFKNHAILKGGMVFKLLGSPRYTNDIDYTFIPYQSKNEVKDEIFQALQSIFDSPIEYDVHSKCIRYYISENNIRMQIEVNVELECKSVELSTAQLARPNNLSARINRVMSYDQALSHKLGAWLERDLLRDLYDIYFIYDIMDENPDLETLFKRLSKIEAQSKNRIKSISPQDFILKLDTAISQLTQNDLSKELQDYLPELELIGLDKKMKIACKKLIHYLKFELF